MELTINNVRKVLLQFSEAKEDAEHLSDEELLAKDLRRDFLMDMVAIDLLLKQLDVPESDRHGIAAGLFWGDSSVSDLLELVNEPED